MTPGGSKGSQIDENWILTDLTKSLGMKPHFWDTANCPPGRVQFLNLIATLRLFCNQLPRQSGSKYCTLSAICAPAQTQSHCNASAILQPVVVTKLFKILHTVCNLRTCTNTETLAYTFNYKSPQGRRLRNESSGHQFWLTKHWDQSLM